jgi:predicted small secreted protein
VNRKLSAVLALACVGLTACASTLEGAGPSCTGAAIRKGISLDIDPAYAAKVGTARLTACWNGSCQDKDLELYPSTASSAAPCTPTGPDTPCSAVSVQTGGKHSFADLLDLPAGPVEVTLRLIDPAGAQLSAPRLTITPDVRYPSGPDCGGGTPQGGLLVSPDGTVSERG